MALPTAQRHYWIFSADPHHYHWDTLFVKGKEMWHRAEEVALFDCGSDARPVSGSARRQGKKSGGRPAGVRTAAAAGGARGAAGESRAAEDEIAEERAGADFFDHRRGVSGDFADVGNCGHAGNSAAVDCTRESARK